MHRVLISGCDDETARILESGLSLYEVLREPSSAATRIFEQLIHRKPTAVFLGTADKSTRLRRLVTQIKMVAPETAVGIIGDDEVLGEVQDYLQKGSVRQFVPPPDPEAVEKFVASSISGEAAEGPKQNFGSGRTDTERGNQITFSVLKEEEDYKKTITEVVDRAFDSLVATSPGYVFYNLNSVFERAVIAAALKYTGSNQVRASKLLGISRNTLRDRMEKYRLS